ncbi:MAG: metallophosphoesterase [Methanomicrobiales archaeon]
MRFCAITLILLLVLLVIAGGCTQSPPSTPSPPAGPVPAGTVAPGNGTWTFAVFGDSPDPDRNTTTGVSPGLIPVAKAIAAEKPDLAIYVGDLTNGWELDPASPVADNYQAQHANWMETVSPIYNYTTGTGIPLYVMRGNHDDGPPRNVTPLLDSFLATVATGMPTNGPPDEKKLTYSFTHKGAKFIVTDDYIAHNGLKETVNQSWVDKELAEDTRPFMFVFGHSPAFMVEDDPEDNDFALAVHPAQRDVFWKSLVDNHVAAYFSGHTHMYVRGEAQGVQQIVNGNAGAKMPAFDPANVSPALKLEYPLGKIEQKDQKVGYIVITVHEDSRTFSGVQKGYNAETGTWITGDTFSFPSR